MNAQEPTGLPEEEFSAVLAGIDKAAPLLRALGGRETAGKEGEGGARHSLLCALKPYLSPARREAADYLLRLFRVGEALTALMREEG